MNRQPNTTYRFDGFSFTTDSLGRPIVSEGRLRLGDGGNRFPYRDRLIGKSGEEGDIGLHLGADQFGFPGGPLNVVPGNKTLNVTGYLKLERQIKTLIADNPNRRVLGQFEAVYNRGNVSNRPDSFRISVTMSGRQRIKVRLYNEAPGG